MPLYGRTDVELAQVGAQRIVVDAKPGFPDRIELRDLDIGEAAILLSYEHQPADTAYRSRHAIFVRERAQQAAEMVDEVPKVLCIRAISLWAFEVTGNMLRADLEDGSKRERLIERFLG